MTRAHYKDSYNLYTMYHVVGMSQREMATEFGCSYKTVRNWMNRYGIPTTRHSMDLESRFWRKVDKGAPDECWVWTGARSSTGYGKIAADGKAESAHRVSYALERADPGDLFVLHKCDNRPCVNPNHLYLGTNSENLQDAWDRDRRDGRGEKSPVAKLTRDDVVEIKAALANGATQVDLADQYGVARQTIGSIDRGGSWSHVQ